ncbi:MAG: hypothetical protein RLZZ433_1606, partial [Pseudomonadota bacterium]
RSDGRILQAGGGAGRGGGIHVQLFLE